MRHLRSIGSAIALAALAGCQAESPRPNVVVLVLDTVRRDHLEVYGYPTATSPHLTELAASAVVYEQAISAAPWTLPSHASLFTGLEPARHEAHHEHLGLAAGNVTLAEHLAGLGYETVGFCNNPWITGRLGMTQGFEQYVEIWRDEVAGDTFHLNIFVDTDTHGMRDAGAARTLDGIANWLETRDASRPFLLFVNLIEAHVYYDPPDAYRNRFTRREFTREEVRAANTTYIRKAYADSLAPELIGDMQALYDAEIAYLDDWVEKFQGLLGEEGVLESTLMVVTSDHGEGFAEHRLCGLPLIDHQLSLHRELLEVPLIIRYPRSDGPVPRPGTRHPDPVSSCDVLPTILDVVGAVVPDSLDGRSLLRPPDPEPRVLVSEYYRPIVHLGLLHRHVSDRRILDCVLNRRIVALQTGTSKLILASDSDPLAYDLARDPHERHPLAAEALDPVLFRKASARLRRTGGSQNLVSPSLDEAMEQTLRALGYIR